MLQRCSQSPDFNLIKVLMWDLKRTAHKQISANINELELSCKGEWANVTPQKPETDDVLQKTFTSSYCC